MRVKHNESQVSLWILRKWVVPRNNSSHAAMHVDDFFVQKRAKLYQIARRTRLVRVSG